MAGTPDLRINFNTPVLPDDLNKLIGKGINFKNIMPSVTQGVNINTGIERINQSIHDILSTRIGERGFMRGYGSELYKLLFAPNDNILYDLIGIYIRDAIRKWEKRIILNTVRVISTPEDIDNNLVKIFLGYTLLNTNISGSYVYPFAKEPMPLRPFGREGSIYD